MTTWDRERALDELERESVDRDEWEQHPSLCPVCACATWGPVVRDEHGQLWHEDCYRQPVAGDAVAAFLEGSE